MASVAAGRSPWRPDCTAFPAAELSSGPQGPHLFFHSSLIKNVFFLFLFPFLFLQ